MSDRLTKEAVEQIAYSPENACFACGPGNPHGLHLHFQERDGVVFADFIPGEWHQGWQNVVHGGVIATLMDEAMAYCLFFRGDFGVTARLETRFREAVRAGDRLRVEARIIREARRLVDTEARVMRGEEIVAESSARFMKVGALAMNGMEDVAGSVG